eukprot:TRINITY_DN6709_c0_g1_i1.p1 TRINITY_DN6709_c0_g1~~TRINITY_DN6709_c0_g1_i1.p1  ORF type:complete len:841 (-),score=225.56 TRINITY_DN6709_c0_g1_i1:80-2455(-)
MKVKANAADYNVHLEYIAAVKAACGSVEGAEERLREAREALAARFPLPEDVWEDWINEEESAAGILEEGIAKVEALYRRALNDYISVDLCKHFCQFSEKVHAPAKTREVYEFVLDLAGAHVTEGAALWDALREFEESLLQLQEESASVATVSRVFQRQLSIPLTGMEECMHAYEGWAAKHQIAVPNDLLTGAYPKALDLLHTLLPFEEQIKDSGNVNEPNYSKLDSWHAYLSFEEQLPEGRRSIQRCRTLHERAVRVYILLPDLWSGYATYLEERMAERQVTPAAVTQLYRRAVRNCNTSGALWSGLICALENSATTAAEIDGTVDVALSSGLATKEDFLEVLNAFVDSARRALNGTAERNTAFRTTCEKAVGFLQQYAPPWETELQRHWAAIEAKHFRNCDRFRELCESVVHARHAEVALWLEYINLERTYGSEANARALFKRAVAAVTDYPAQLYMAWLQFERECGQLASYLDIKHQLAKKLVDETQRQAKLAEAQQRHQKRQQPVRRDKPQMGEAAEPPRKKQRFSGSAEDAPAAATPSVKPRPSSNPQTVFVSNLRFAMQENDIRDVFSKFGTIVAVRHVAKKGYGFVQFDTEASAKQALSLDGTDVGGRPINVKPTKEHPVKWNETQPEKDKAEGGAPSAEANPAERGQRLHRGFGVPPPTRTVEQEARTLFLTNLSFKAMEADVMEAFAQSDVKEVRVVRDLHGKSKGYAYVEFVTPEAATAGLSLDHTVIAGRAVKLRHSTPPERKAHAVQMEAAVVAPQAEAAEEKQTLQMVPRALKAKPPTQ